MSQAVIGLVRDLARLLSAEDLSTETVVTWLGDHPVDLQGNVLVEEPGVAGVSRASVVRQVGSARDEPAHVTLELTSGMPLQELQAEFGAAKLVAPDHPGQPQSAVFALAETDVRLIAEVRNGAVSRLTLTRETRLA